MDITPAIPKERLVIRSYGDGGFVINHHRSEGSIILTPQQVYPLATSTLDALTPEDLSPILQLTPEIVLLGVGPLHCTTPFKLKQWALTHKLHIDSMTTGAACRTYNILLAEDRHVVAILLAV